MAIKDNIIQEVLFQRLAPLAIVKYWSLIQQCLLDALSGQKASEGHASRLMAAVQAGRIQVWCATSKGEKPVLAGMVFTQVNRDPFLGTNELLIYGLSIRAQATQEVYSYCLDQIAEYAKANDCYALRAQTNKSGVKRLLENAGWHNGVCTLIKEI
jgi:hypothetical protein